MTIEFVKAEYYTKYTESGEKIRQWISLFSVYCTYFRASLQKNVNWYISKRAEIFISFNILNDRSILTTHVKAGICNCYQHTWYLMKVPFLKSESFIYDLTTNHVRNLISYITNFIHKEKYCLSENYCEAITYTCIQCYFRFS